MSHFPPPLQILCQNLLVSLQVPLFSLMPRKCCPLLVAGSHFWDLPYPVNASESDFPAALFWERLGHVSFSKVNHCVANWAICDSGLRPHEAILWDPTCLHLINQMPEVLPISLASSRSHCHSRSFLKCPSGSLIFVLLVEPWDS